MALQKGGVCVRLGGRHYAFIPSNTASDRTMAEGHQGFALPMN